MKAKDFRQSAWKSLSGKWGICILVFIIFDLISAACAGGSTIVIGAVAGLIIMGPMTLGYSMVSLNVARDKDVEISMLFKGFNDFARSVVLYIVNNIFIALWSLLLIIPGIIKSLAYSMSYYILIDDATISANDARKKSIEMMKGNKWRLFCLKFSFIGWVLLSFLTFGILLFWVMPYIEVTMAKFYLSLLPEEQNSNVDRVDLDNDATSIIDNTFDKNDFDAFAKEDSKEDFKF